MSRPKKYSHHLIAAKDEALFACDLYNQHRQPRSIEGFLVHMGIAWCNLLQAIFERDGVSYFYRKSNGRYEHIDGERKSWDLSRMLREQFPDPNNAVRRNAEFFLGLRNKVEHRLTATARAALRTVVEGKAQSYMRNFEQLLAAEFGSGESLSRDLHLPIFLSSLDDSAVAAIKDVRKALPKGVASYISDFDANLPADIAQSDAYEFKIYLIPKTSGPTASDTALEFVNVKNLTDVQRQALENALVIIRDRQVEVANLKRMKPGAVITRVKAHYATFNITHHTWAWKFHKVRPASTKEKSAKAKTDPRYCIYDEGHDDYVYTEAWVALLLKELGNDTLAAIAKWKDGASSS